MIGSAVFIVLVVLLIRNVGRIVPQRNLPWILGGYCIILLSSLIVLPMLPKANLMDTVSEKVLEQAKRASLDFHNAALAGRPEQVDGVYKLEQWDFAFSGNQLVIAGTANDYGIMIIAERKGANDGKIEVINYATKTIMERVDLTNEIKPPKVSLEDNRLIITRPQEHKLEFTKFNKDFVLAQLPRDGREQDRHTILGSQVLYLRIPKDVQIDDVNQGIQFVVKE